MHPVINIPNISLSYINNTKPNMMKLNIENMILSTWIVKNLSTRLWSFIRCNKSPINLVSKNDIGNFRSLTKKSLTIEIFIRILICSKSHLRIKSIIVRLNVRTIWPKRISQIKLTSLWVIPISTIDCVKNGKISCNMQPISSPNVICPKNFLYCLIYLNRKPNERFFFLLSLGIL